MVTPLEIKKKLELKIHGEELFDKNYSTNGLSEDLQGWLSSQHVLDTIIDKTKPNFVIEVGSWKGCSAIHMAKKLKEHHSDFAMICIDTWLGSVEHRLAPHLRDSLNLAKGWPQLYQQFLCNVYLNGFGENILPIPLPSDQAAIILKQFNLQVPMIYLDAAHDEENIRLDMENYWGLLAPGGIMVGDDYTERWPGIILATNKFAELKAKEIMGQLMVDGNKWVLQKSI
ncbi:MAG: class I SAM-dependent methyltransferase [Rhodospirillales bacterium]|nr:class I SAM-dependent methyltransferase [Rhodospirillales bacterium]